VGPPLPPSRTEMNQPIPPPIRHQEGQQDDSNDSNNDDAFVTTTELLKETTLMIQKLNPQQLMQVRQLIASMLSSSSSGYNCNHNATSAASSFSGMKSQMNIHASQTRQQQITVLGDVNMVAGGLFPMQSFPQAIPGPQFPMQQGQSPHLPHPIQSTSTPVQYFSTEHHFENGIPQQAMGISNNHTAVPMGSMHRPPDATLSLSPPPPPIVAFASPALPPVEKEGNPFDF
jgi:hypothetical protein